MNLKEVHDRFTGTLQSVYDKAEAENIWKLASEKVFGTVLHRESYLTLQTEEGQLHQFQVIKDRLLKHEPIQYIINECWFYDIPFYVDNNVLIPRPETEELVDWVIKENRQLENAVILDVGTGSGCIPIILKRKIPQAEIYSCDISGEALSVAVKNAVHYNITIDFLQVDFLNEKDWKLFPEVDIIVSNPPYIPYRDRPRMRENVVGHEPHLALFVKDDNPLIFYEAIRNFAEQKLKPGGSIYLEIHEDLANQTMMLFEQKNFSVTLKKDMQEKRRMLKVVRHQ